MKAARTPKWVFSQSGEKYRPGSVTLGEQLSRSWLFQVVDTIIDRWHPLFFFAQVVAVLSSPAWSAGEGRPREILACC
jgi:hypothetical protein